MPNEIPGEIMVNAIDIYHGVTSQDKAGGVQYPEFPSLLAVPCSCQPRDVEEMIDEQNRVTEFQNYHIFFNDDPQVRPRDKLVYVDASNTTRTLFARATRDEGGQRAYFVVRAVERI